MRIRQPGLVTVLSECETTLLLMRLLWQKWLRQQVKAAPHISMYWWSSFVHYTQRCCPGVGGWGSVWGVSGCVSVLGHSQPISWLCQKCTGSIDSSPRAIDGADLSLSTPFPQRASAEKWTVAFSQTKRTVRALVRPQFGTVGSIRTLLPPMGAERDVFRKKRAVWGERRAVRRSYLANATTALSLLS